MSGHTPGPWRWVVNPKHHSVELSRGSYGDIVMSFERWGMGGATPMFNVNGVLERAVDISEPEDGRMHHADWWRVINHPDANLIAAAPELLEALLRMRDEVREFLPNVCGEALTQAEAVIRKARGETP